MTEIKDAGKPGPGRAALALMAMLALLLLPAGCQKAGDGVGLGTTGERLTFCQQFPDDTACKPPVDPCIANPDLPACQDSCETVPPAPGCSVVVAPTKVKFARVMAIFKDQANGCQQCHMPGGAGAGQGKLVLSDDSAYANLVNVKVTNQTVGKGWSRVVPFKPDSSMLFHKVTMNPPKPPGLTAPYGGLMPLGATKPLDTSITNVIKQWILDGAEK